MTPARLTNARLTNARLPRALLVLAILAGCGADGAPVAPSQSAGQPGIRIVGQAELGMVGH